MPEKIEQKVFLIDEAPCVFWGRIQETNRRFLSGIDVGYWDYQATTHGEQINTDGESAQHAASALRLVYGQGIETLLGMLCALAQAPWFPVGWMEKYKNRHLRSVVGKIHSGEPLPSAWPEPLSWESLATVVHSIAPEPAKSDPELDARFGALWRYFAAQFLEPHFEPEYNNLKHGMRAAVGPFGLSIKAPIRENNAASATTTLIGRAEFGSTFRYSRRIPGTRHSYEFFEDVSLAWSPSQFVRGIRLIGCSIGNIVTRLRHLNGDSNELEFRWPMDPAAFNIGEDDSDEQSWIRGVTFTRSVDPDKLPPEASADEIRAVYADAIKRGYGHSSGHSESQISKDTKPTTS